MVRKKIQRTFLPALTVVVITKNEEEMIVGCLESVDWADEVIVIDDHSTDQTRQLAKKYASRVITHTSRGFASQKNYGIKLAQGKWILILDADERVSGQLRKEIVRVINDPGSITAFNILFVNYFLGREMKFGGWQNEYHLRLFKRGYAQYTAQEIHEVLAVKGETAPISGVIYHFSHRSIADNLLKTRHYALLESAYLYHRHSPLVTRRSLLKHMWYHFWYRYIKTKGYKDGMTGFIEAIYQTFSQIFIIQSMLWERQRGQSSSQIYLRLDKHLKSNNWSSLPQAT